MTGLTVRSGGIGIDSSRTNKRRRPRTGAIAVFAAFMMVLLLGMVAFAVDLGYLAVARTESQRTADATAHATAIEFARSRDINDAINSAYEVAIDFTKENRVLAEVASVSPGVDVTIGRYEFHSGQTALSFGDPSDFNAVRVRIRRTDDQNGSVPLFFGSVLGRKQQALVAEATAALIRNVKGFKIPPTEETVPVLPITLKEDFWDSAKPHCGSGNQPDDWAYDAESGTVSRRSDGVSEVVLFPNRTQSAGNLGTVNIGVSNNSTSYLRNQIRNGLTQSDLDHHGGSLELDSSGVLELSGNPGLSAAIQKDLQSIVGEVRVVPLYRSVSGNGNNARFTIVRFVAARIMSARLTGNDKAIWVQPARLSCNGVIQGTESGQSEGIYSSPRLVD